MHCRVVRPCELLFLGGVLVLNACISVFSWFALACVLPAEHCQLDFCEGWGDTQSVQFPEVNVVSGYHMGCQRQ